MKKKQKFDPFQNLVLDTEEQEIEDAFERGEFTRVRGKELERTKKLLQEAAKNTIALRKSQPITLRVNTHDLLKVKAKAQAKRIPYQTLLGAVIHQYADGKSRMTI